MAISWDSLRSILLFLGPIILPKAIGYYRSLRNSASTHGLRVQPVPPPVRNAIILLALLASTCVIKTLPAFAPENLFVRTQSRLQVPVDVLFNRVLAVRPENTLTRTDHALRAKFVNLESRLLYLQFGPDVVAECPFCNSDEPKSYFYYAFTSLLWPHIANLFVIAIVTSPTFTGRWGAQWRTIAAIATAVLAALDGYLTGSYNHQANARALRLPDIDFFFWNMRTYRLLSIALLDVALATLLYLSSTNRAFVQLPSPAERVERVNRYLAVVKSKLSAMGIMRNTAMRDEDLRTRGQSYWAHEVRLMGEIMEEREVIEGVNDALDKRINIESITRDAEVYAKNVLQPLEIEGNDGTSG